MCAAITTIISGLTGFFGNKHKKFFKTLFCILIILLPFIFVKEIICFLDQFFLVGAMVIILFIIVYFLNNRIINVEVESKTILCLVIICLTIVVVFIQKYIVNIYTPNYLIYINDFINTLSNVDKIIDIYHYIFDSQNIIYTFSYIFNIIIICLNIYITNRLIDYQNGLECKIGNIICYSIALFILSCGAGIKIMQIIISKF